MKIEVLFPEVANLFGDMMNIEYLHRCVPEAEIVRTSLRSAPLFASEKVDMIFMAPMTEHSQELVINALRPYKEKLRELIDGGTVFFVTGNAMEVFWQYIETDDAKRIEALGLFDLHAKREMMNRYNSLYLGKLGDIDIVGFKSQFAHTSGRDTDHPLFVTTRGGDREKPGDGEGLHVNNFIATYLLGPILVTNPDFTKWLLRLLGVENPTLAFEEAAYDSYNLRLKEFSDPNRSFMY